MFGTEHPSFFSLLKALNTQSDGVVKIWLLELNWVKSEKKKTTTVSHFPVDSSGSMESPFVIFFSNTFSQAEAWPLFLLVTSRMTTETSSGQG